MNTSPFNIVFYKGETIISKLIKKLTKGKYSHCALVLMDSYHVVQLDWKTPTSIQHLNYERNMYDVYELTFELTVDEQIGISQYILDRLSTTYDFKFICSRFFNLFFNTKTYNSKDKYNCDELIIDAFRSVGINLLNGDEKISPEILSKSKLLKIKS